MTLETKEVVREIIIKLNEAKQEGFIIPDLVFEIIKNVEDFYESAL